MKIRFFLNFVRGRGYCKYPAFKEALAYQLLHRSINDKNAVQAKHIRIVGIPVLLHRMVIKVSRNQIRKLDRTEKHDNSFGKLRMKKVGSFQKRKVLLFLQWSTSGATHQKNDVTTGWPIIASQCKFFRIL